MTVLYVVHGTIGGYAREDAACSTVYGVYTDAVVAKRVATVAGGKVDTVELDYVALGYAATAAELGLPINNSKPAKTAAQHFDALYQAIATSKNYVKPEHATMGGMWTVSRYANGEWFAGMMDEGYSRYIGRKVNDQVVWRVNDYYPKALEFCDITEEEFLKVTV